MKPKVGIFTTFTGVDEAYSLVNVVRTQIQMLLAKDYDPVVFVTNPFTESGIFSPKFVDLRKTVHYDSKSVDILSALKEMTKDIDVMLCHDIVFLSQHQEWGKAIRRLAERNPHIAWLHWQHSRGDGTVELMKNSWYCYPNKGDLPHIASLNQTRLNRVRYIPHPLDFDYLGWASLAVRIAEDTGFPFADVSIILPSRLDRQKQVERIIRIAAGIKRAGRSVCFLLADAYATGDRFMEYKKDLRQIAKEQDVDKEVIFLGDNYSECKFSTPRPVVKALYEMANLFIQPSTSETSSLVVMEAALAGNLVIVNSDFSPIHHLYKKALTLPFGSIFEPTKYYRHVRTAEGESKIEDPQQFWDDEAKNTILPAIDSQLTLAVKKQQLRERWPSRVFNEYLEPLIMEVFNEEME